MWPRLAPPGAMVGQGRYGTTVEGADNLGQAGRCEERAEGDEEERERPLDRAVFD